MFYCMWPLCLEAVVVVVVVAVACDALRSELHVFSESS